MSDVELTPPNTLSLPQPSRRYHALDCWRGFTCMLLVVYHSTMHIRPTIQSESSWLNKLGFALLSATRTLDVGVPIFFVISGYCIMATLDARSRAGEGIGAYFWRRFHRIYPPCWIALGISAVVIWLGETLISPWLFTRAAFKMTAPQRLGLWEWLGNLSLTESWRHHLTGGKATYLVGHAWTLCYEEQFYAVAGLILYFAPTRMFQAACILTICISLVQVWGALNGIPLEGTIVGIPWLYFSAGIMAYFGNHRTGPRARTIILTLLALAIFLPALDSRRIIFAHAHGRYSWVFAMLSAFLISALHQYDRRLQSWRLLRPFSFCGKICYSLYLIHPLVTTGIGHAFYRWGMRGHWETLLITLPFSFILSLAAGALFYWVVERHFLNPTTEIGTKNPLHKMASPVPANRRVFRTICDAGAR